MTLAARTSVTFDGIRKLIPALWGKPRIAAILMSWLNEVQALETAIFATIDARILDNATGAQLRMLGKIVGQANYGWDDVSYRAAIRARVRANLSQGRAIDLWMVANLLAPGAVVQDGRAPLNARVSWSAPIGVDETAVRQLLSVTRSAAVLLEIFRAGGSNPFTYRSASDPDNSSLGYASTATTEGGVYSFGEIV